MSIGFFFLAISKGLLLMQYGLEPYEIIIDAVGLPGFFSYYGFVAVVLELCFAIGVWEKKTFTPAIILASVLTGFGVVISLALLAFKINSDCGCGLLGDSEGWLLLQKGLILAGLIILYKNKIKLFDATVQV